MSYFSVINNSTDTIGYSVYLHERSDMNNSDVYFLMSGNSVAPRDTVKPYIEYMGKGYSWRDCFDYLGVDTAYVCISKKSKRLIGKNINYRIRKMSLRFLGSQRKTLI